MQDNSKPSRWPETDKFGQAWGETSKSLSKCQSEDQLAQACQARILLSEKTPFKMVHIDLVRPLPKSSGFKYILTAIDRASRYPIAVPPLWSTETMEVWNTFEDNFQGTYPAVFRMGISIHICLLE